MKIKTKRESSLRKDSSQVSVFSERERSSSVHRKEFKERLNDYLKDGDDSIGVSPLPFQSRLIPLVPLFMSNLMDWFIHYKPKVWKETDCRESMQLSSASYVSSKPGEMFNVVKNCLDKWFTGSFTFREGFFLANCISKNLDVLSMFDEKVKQVKKNEACEGKFRVAIEESSTFLLFSESKRCAVRGTKTADEFEKENDEYSANLKKCKQRYNKSTQTRLVINESKYCGPLKPLTEDKVCFSSTSIIFDAVKILLSSLKKERFNMTDNRLSKTSLSIDYSHQTYVQRKSVYENPEPDEIDDHLAEAVKMVNIIESEEFFRLSLIMGRVLERNKYEGSQQKIKVGSNLNPVAEKVIFDYSLTHFRTISFAKVWCLPVTSISVNSINKNIFAVGHGKFFYDQPEGLGRVNLWNIKNLSVPEKSAEFKLGVSSVAFSAEFPYVLLVSFVSGLVLILNISKETPLIMASSKSDYSIDRAWQAYWFKSDTGHDVAVSCGGGGVVSWFHPKNFQRHQLLTLHQNEEATQGIKAWRTSNERDNESLAVSIVPDIVCLAPDPTHPLLYMAGTEDGCVHMCSTDCGSKHLGSMQAHEGPVHHIKYHPDTPLVFFTIGVDFCVRIWAFAIYEPLLTIVFDDIVEDADWCPQHPTILVVVSGCQLSVWDIRKILLEPCSIFKSPTGTRFTTVKFLNTNSILIGDVNGNVHILSLGGLPFSPMCRPVAIAKSLKRVLSINQDILEDLRKLGYPFDVDD